MPVWHETLRELRADGALTFVGITQEQHPDRCRLFAQWKGFDWPILWDPFNLTGASSVPIVTFVDEYGVVREAPSRPDELAAWLAEQSFEAPDPHEAAQPEVRSELCTEAAPESVHEALAQLLFGGEADLARGLAYLEGAAAELEPEDSPQLLFQLGVARRMRYDSSALEPADFQASIDAWAAALAVEPNQYIWRRRIQQYGPRLDKPYPFYDWVEAARSQVTARGERPHPLRVALTGTERASGTRAMPANPGEHSAPDPRRKITQDSEGLVAIESAVVVHTGRPGAIVRARSASRVHLALRPNVHEQVRWSDDAGPALVWVAVPRGWRIERNLFHVEPGEDAASNDTPDDVRRIDFEIVPTDDAAESGATHLLGYALYHVCEGEEGECVYRRQDFRVDIPVKSSGGWPPR